MTFDYCAQEFGDFYVALQERQRHPSGEPTDEEFAEAGREWDALNDTCTCGGPACGSKPQRTAGSKAAEGGES